jgi:predicted lipoprotein with Yx(FWY)xxD motif
MLILSLGCIQPTPPVNNTTACTAEAKICPDGSAVGRTGPNCEFAPCPQIVGNDSDIHGCKASAGYSWCEPQQKCVHEWETPCQMTVADALGIARASSCMDAGNITDVDAVYNNNSKTWWLGIQITQPGCNPACVVYENRTAEINWRCTGLIVYTVKAANSSLGGILVDGSGFTLYTFSSDSVNKSTCTGGCASNWPPLLVKDTISVPSSLPGRFGAFARMDNLSLIQVTYNGMPLYTYAGDSAPGDTNGQGISGKWYAVHPTD